MIRWTCFALSVAVAACGRPPSAPPAVTDELEPLSVTQWTDRTELFAEYPPLVVGQTSRFAIHLTRLDTFKALLEGQVEVQLSGGAGPIESFPVERPSRPGIFGVDVVPAHAGARDLTIVLRHPGLDDRHVVGAVTVHATPAAAQVATADDAGGAEPISFLKEQQWALDFATAVVADGVVRQSVRVSAQVRPRPGGEADVAAPIAGRLVGVADVLPGASVAQGQVLARVQPPPSAPAELPLLYQAQAEAASVLGAATRDRERAERLVAAGAAPQKRLDDSRAAEEQARARATGADARLASDRAARTAGTGQDDGQFVVRAPLSGVVAERAAAAGANVSAGDVLFRVIDTDRVHVVGHVPEPTLADARRARSAEIEVPGHATRLDAGRLLGLGKVLDSRTRSVPMTFAFDNTAASLAIGQSVFLHLQLDQAAPRALVAASAIVDDAGRPIVFVQTEGESFERRAVTLGPRSGGVVQVIDGVRAGERVVTTGAYLVRLASLSTQVPAHGHVH